MAIRAISVMLSNERCNLDDVQGERHVESQLPPDIDSASLCRNCFPFDSKTEAEMAKADVELGITP